MWDITFRRLRRQTVLRAAAITALAGGCATPDGASSDDGSPSVFSRTPSSLSRSRSGEDSPISRSSRPSPIGPIQQASFRTRLNATNPVSPALAAQPATPTALEDFIRLAVEQNPRLTRANLAIAAAQGRRQQAGLYPNPELGAFWDEIGDRTSVNGSGIVAVPRITQPIVRGRKLSLAQAVAAREVDQATLTLLSERYTIIGDVRGAFYEALALQYRAEILTELLKLAESAVDSGKALLNAKPAQIARLDYLQLEVERERFRAELHAVQQALPGVYRRLAAVSGNQAAIPIAISGKFDGLPDYDPDLARQAVLNFHPLMQHARVGVDRAQAAVRRAEAEPIPNVSVSGGFIRQFENRSYDGAFGLSMPVPVWNRNQGNIRAAKAELGMAIQTVGQTENELAAKVALAYQTYASARERAEIYRKEMIPRAEETYKLSLAAFKGGQFEYLRVIQAQRAIAEARLELNKSLGEAWRAAGELSGLLLEDTWPNPPTGPGAGPVMEPPVPPKGEKKP